MTEAPRARTRGLRFNFNRGGRLGRSLVTCHCGDLLLNNQARFQALLDKAKSYFGAPEIGIRDLLASNRPWRERDLVQHPRVLQSASPKDMARASVRIIVPGSKYRTFLPEASYTVRWDRSPDVCIRALATWISR